MRVIDGEFLLANIVMNMTIIMRTFGKLLYFVITSFYSDTKHSNNNRY